MIARIPLYRQVRDYILDGIEKGRWSSGEALPSENQLADTFGVSRITIKHALTTLVEERLVYRIQGKGTFISPESKGEPPVFEQTFDDGKGRDGAGRQIETGLNAVAFLCPRLHNSYMATLLNGIEENVGKNGSHVIYARTHDSQERETQELRELRKLGVKGVIIYPVDGETYNDEILRLHLANFPLVVIDRYLRGLETNCVYSDNLFGGYQATDHLLKLGHRNIAFVSTILEGTTSIEDRLAGYEKAFADNNVPLQSEHRLFTLKTLDEDNRQVIRDYLKNHPEITAVLAVNSTLGLQAVSTAQELGLRIPDDLSVVFFDFTDQLSFKPTYIQQQAEDAAREAVQLLFESIADPQKKKMRIQLPTRLIEGDSSAPPLRVTRR